MKVEAEVDKTLLRAAEALSGRSLEDILRERVNKLFERFIFDFESLCFSPLGETVYCPFCHQKVDAKFYAHHVAVKCPGVSGEKVRRLISDLVTSKSMIPALDELDPDDPLWCDWNEICRYYEEKVKVVLESWGRLKNLSQRARDWLMDEIDYETVWWGNWFVERSLFIDFKPLR